MFLPLAWLLLQELIETLVWAHERTSLANFNPLRDKPVALSIGASSFSWSIHFRGR
jgi:photosystem I P700 chlorophyll a apoprotein A2